MCLKVIQFKKKLFFSIDQKPTKITEILVDIKKVLNTS